MALRLIYLMFSKLLSWMVLLARSDTAKGIASAARSAQRVKPSLAFSTFAAERTPGSEGAAAQQCAAATDYWAADALAELGANVHLVHPLGVKMFSYRRVKNDERDAADLADLLRMGRLPEAWIAPPATRELRGWVRHRAKLVGLRSNLKCQVHGVLAGAGVTVAMSDLFGVAGPKLLARAPLSVESRSRVDSTLRLITALEFEIDLFAKLVAGRLRADRGYVAIQAIHGVGPILAAVFVAEIGDITRFHRPGHLASWAELTPGAGRWCHGPRSTRRGRPI